MAGAYIKVLSSFGLPQLLCQLNKLEIVKILRLFSIKDFFLDHALVYLLFVSLFVFGPLLPILWLVLNAHVPAPLGRQLLLLVCYRPKATLVLLDLFPGVEHVTMPV